MAIHQEVAMIYHFMDFFKMAAVCHLKHIWTTHEGYLVVFIVVHNLVRIDAAVLIIIIIIIVVVVVVVVVVV